MNKRIQYLGFILEYSRFSKMWFVIDWDYECENTVGIFPTKARAMQFCEDRMLGRD